MKKLFLLFVCLFALNYSFADTQQNAAPPAPTYVSFTACQKNYSKPPEQLYYVVLSSVIKNNYKVVEIQSKNGLLIFKAYNKEFLANITQLDSKTTHLKITPVDNNYNFSFYLLDNLFKTIDVDLAKNIYKIN